MSYDDDNAIRRIIFAYAWAMDTKDWELLGSCFEENAEFSYGNGPASLPHPHGEDSDGDLAVAGRASFVAHIAHTHEHVISCHMMGATAITFESEETATARTYGRLLLVPIGLGNAAKFESAGVYDDALRRTDGVWRIGSRRYTRLWADGNPDALAQPAA